MTRRHLTLTMTLSIDNDLATTAQPFNPDGTSDYSYALNEVRSACLTAASLGLRRYDVELGDAEFAFTGTREEDTDARS